MLIAREYRSPDRSVRISLGLGNMASIFCSFLVLQVCGQWYGPHIVYGQYSDLPAQAIPAHRVGEETASSRTSPDPLIGPNAKNDKYSTAAPKALIPDYLNQPKPKNSQKNSPNQNPSVAKSPNSTLPTQQKTRTDSTLADFGSVRPKNQRSQLKKAWQGDAQGQGSEQGQGAKAGQGSGLRPMSNPNLTAKSAAPTPNNTTVPPASTQFPPAAKTDLGQRNGGQYNGGLTNQNLKNQQGGQTLTRDQQLQGNGAAQKNPIFNNNLAGTQSPTSPPTGSTAPFQSSAFQSPPTRPWPQTNQAAKSGTARQPTGSQLDLPSQTTQTNNGLQPQHAIGTPRQQNFQQNLPQQNRGLGFPNNQSGGLASQNIQGTRPPSNQQLVPGNDTRLVGDNSNAGRFGQSNPTFLNQGRSTQLNQHRAGSGFSGSQNNPSNNSTQPARQGNVDPITLAKNEQARRNKIAQDYKAKILQQMDVSVDSFQFRPLITRKNSGYMGNAPQTPNNLAKGGQGEQETGKPNGNSTKTANKPNTANGGEPNTLDKNKKAGGQEGLDSLLQMFVLVSVCANIALTFLYLASKRRYTELADDLQDRFFREP